MGYTEMVSPTIFFNLYLLQIKIKETKSDVIRHLCSFVLWTKCCHIVPDPSLLILVEL